MSPRRRTVLDGGCPSGRRPPLRGCWSRHGGQRTTRPIGTGIDDLVVRVGLIGTDPDASLAAAKEGLAAGELEPAYRSAQAAAAVWSSAVDIGRSRMVSAALLVLALVLFLGLVRQSRQSRRKRAAEPG